MEKSRERKRWRISSLSFCQRLILSLDKPSKLLALPTEIRQLVLENVLDDEKLTSDLSLEARRLAVVCKAFRDDMQWVLQRWQRRKEELAVVRNGAFSFYIADLMAPLLAASRSQALIQSSRTPLSGYMANVYNAKRVQMKRDAILHGHAVSHMRHADDQGNFTSLRKPGAPALSATEKLDSMKWQALRDVNVQKMRDGKMKSEKSRGRRRRYKENKRKRKEPSYK
jgi:hypothetical protein